MASLAEQLSNLTNPNPVFDDPEDIVDDTAAKLIVSHYDEEDDDDLALEGATKIRSRAAALIGEEAGTKYAGKRTSRKQIQQAKELATYADSDEEVDDASDESPDEDGEGTDSDDVIHSDDEDEQIAGFREKMKFQSASPSPGGKFSFEAGGDFSQYGEDSEDGSEDEDDSDDEDEDEDTDEDGEEEEDEEDMEEDTEEAAGEMRPFSKVNVEDEVTKGRAVRSQLGIWDSLLEARIKLQKTVVSANQLPPPEKWAEFWSAGGPEYQKAVEESQTFLQKLLGQLVGLQSALLHQNTETKKMDAGQGAKSKPKPRADPDDEEITSESDLGSDEEDGQSEALRQILKRKMSTKEYPEFIAKRHANFRAYRNTTIQKWFDKTRVASGRLNKGFSGFEQSAVKQIDQILGDKTRLIRRTQLKRSAYEILGKPAEKPTEQKVDDDTPQDEISATRELHLKDYDAEIFDDDDFYHQLLRELIERKTSEVSDPVALSRQWLQIQKLRSKSKKVVDRKASKGRKIRYNIHSKLVNFMAPVETSEWTDEAKNELYKSLFGKNSSTTEEAR